MDHTKTGVHVAQRITAKKDRKRWEDEIQTFGRFVLFHIDTADNQQWWVHGNNSRQARCLQKGEAFS